MIAPVRSDFAPLHERPRYRAGDGPWRDSFFAAVGDAGPRLRWDTAALLGIVGRNYATGDRTLVQEVVRQPWLAAADGETLRPVPPHGRFWLEPREAAAELRARLRREAEAACRGAKRIFLLLSGGLDSRIVAGVLAELHREGRLESRPIGVTWGLEDSRDVAYGREVARLLDFEWRHLPLTEDHLEQNIRREAPMLGAPVSPLHLHRMAWLRQIEPGDRVLAASFGDSIGRAEFCGVHLLALPGYRAIARFGLLRPEVVADGAARIAADLAALHGRDPGAPAHARLEWEQMAFYMRNQLADAMAASAPPGALVQLFTAPEVYSFIWSLHPAARGDDLYFTLLESLAADLARLPWARTNRAVRGRTVGARPELRPSFHRYAQWTSGPLLDRIAAAADPVRLESTGLFDAGAVRRLVAAVREDPDARGRDSLQIHERLAWLASIGHLLDRLEAEGKSMIPWKPEGASAAAVADRRPEGAGDTLANLRRALLNVGRMRPVQRRLLALRREWKRRRALRDWPPVPWRPDGD